MSLRQDRLTAYNERIKHFAAFLTAIGLGLIGFSMLRPLTDGTTAMPPSSAVWGVVGLVMHGLAHYVLRMMKKEADR